MVSNIPVLLSVRLLTPRQSKTFIDTMAPVLAETFKTLDDTGLYSSVETLTASASILFFGKMNEIYPSKWVLLSVLFLFLVGETVCGTASSAPTFVAGRAVTGLGFAGVFATIMIIIVDVFPLRRQPFIVGSLAAAFTIGTIMGPLFGGIITSRISFRWCFFLTIFIGVAIAPVMYFTLQYPKNQAQDAEDQHAQQKSGYKHKFLELDPLGNLTFAPAVACLLLALSWGGFVYPWSSGRIIVLLILSAVLTIAFVATQVYFPKTAMVPGYLLKNRNIVSGVLYSACVAGAMTAAGFYIPLWFQVVRGFSAEKSGVHTLPMVLATTISAILTGVFVGKLGYYTPFMFLGALVEAVGAGLLTTISTNTSFRTFAGFQILFGIGAGMSLQQPLVAVQTVLPKGDVPKGSALILLGQTLGCSVFVCVAQAVLTNGLQYELAAIQGLSPELQKIASTGPAAFRSEVPENMLPAVLKAYNGAIAGTFWVAVSLSIVAFVFTIGMEWRSVKKKKSS